MYIHIQHSNKIYYYVAHEMLKNHQEPNANMYNVHNRHNLFTHGIESN